MNITNYANETIWFQRYRPRTFDEIIINETQLQEIKSLVETRKLSHLIIAGPPGTGKTTLAKVIIEALEADSIYINASAERGIDVIREKIVNYSATRSFDGNQKIVHLDEADRLTLDAQLALRAVMESYSTNTIFILTANYPDNIDDAIRSSRCIEIKFDTETNKSNLMARIAKRCVQILKSENVKFEPDALKEIIKAKYPDVRAIVQTLQKYGAKGSIDNSIIDQVKSTSFEAVIKDLKEKKFKNLVHHVMANIPDPSLFVNEFWRQSEKFVAPKSLPYLSVILDDAQERLLKVPNRQLTLVATLTKISAEVEFN
ncbi:replication factor C small subunit [Agrobacterium phage Atu_ph04]|uniref:Sliding-clamp-loader large subunit n=1 Tax=Agrobacterium phage Atu_ph04 TaxID=2024263 RepID=A0A223VZR9_9CAUD|nr:replication factor C small subunit [Agrobacterium phage Atu_ph04]ASV44660.2 replication factor C small subunit [Agrobacterium phage Atu_ph04]